MQLSFSTSLHYFYLAKKISQMLLKTTASKPAPVFTFIFHFWTTTWKITQLFGFSFSIEQCNKASFMTPRKTYLRRKKVCAHFPKGDIFFHVVIARIILTTFPVGLFAHTPSTSTVGDENLCFRSFYASDSSDCQHCSESLLLQTHTGRNNNKKYI